MKMRKFFAFTAAAAILAALGIGAHEARAAEAPLAGDKKALVVYFSKTGNTQGVAEIVAKLTGAEIFRLETVEPYPDDYHTSTEVAKRQLEENARPALKAVPQDLARYDVIFLGHPVWWHTIPTPVMTFLEGAKLAGKTIIPFCTHGGGGADESAAAIRKLAPSAAVLDDKEFYGGASEEEIADWLASLK